MPEVDVGNIVKAHYNSGSYVGKVLEDRGNRYLVEVLAVLKHPLQGDLHNMGKVEDVFFHERKALFFREKMNVKKPAVHPYQEDIPAYGESLKEATKIYREKLSNEDTAYNRKALDKLNYLEEAYYIKRYYTIK